MRRLLRAIEIYLGTRFTWRTAWEQAAEAPTFAVAARDDGLTYVEPKVQR